MADITLDQLIVAIGKAEGRGVEKIGGQYVWRVYNKKNRNHPFGLIGDLTLYPVLLTDPQACYEFVRRKILNVNGNVYIPGLVDSNMKVDINKIGLLANKWAPLNAENDPDGLNDHWLQNVYDALGVYGPPRPSVSGPTVPGVRIPYDVYYPVAKDSVKGKPRYIPEWGGFCSPGYYKNVVPGIWHPGVDYNTATGDLDLGEPIYAMASGTVRFAGDAGSGWGYLITIDHPHLLRTSTYGHVQTPLVSVGQQVSAGQLISFMGNGATTLQKAQWSAHLHFEVRINMSLKPAYYPKGQNEVWVRENYEDPETFLARMGAKEPGTQKKEGELHPDLKKARLDVINHLKTARPDLELVTTRVHEPRAVTLNRMRKEGIKITSTYTSPHNVIPALAFDFQIRVKKTKTALPPSDPIYAIIGGIFKKAGVVWGGEMTEVKGEKVKKYHVELPKAAEAIAAAQEDAYSESDRIATVQAGTTAPVDVAVKGC